MAVNPDVPAKTLPELVIWARANKGKVFNGYSGSTFQVPAESLNRIGQMGSTAVPFKSSPDVMTEVIVDRLSGTLQKILTNPDVKQRMLAANIEAMPMDPVTFDAYVKAQLKLWGQKVKDAGIQPE